MERVKGTFDFYPEDKYTKEMILDTLRGVAEHAGFLWVETPALETIKLLTRKSGEEIKKQIFVIEERGSEQFGLRFDMTVPLTRMFIAKQRELPKPVKWCYSTRMWRYEAPQRGRLREFYQYGIEVFGSPSIAADAEVIHLVISSLAALGITENDIRIHINNRKLIQGLLFDLVPKDKIEAVLRIIDHAPKTTEEDTATALEKAGIKKVKEILRVISLKGDPEKICLDLEKLPLNELAKQGLREIKELCALVPCSCMVLDLSTVRGLAYYTGTVFECFDAQGKYRALAGGGRYDDLVQLLGGDPTPAVGFAIGHAPLSLLLSDLGILPKKKTAPLLYCVVIDEACRLYAQTVVQKLRKKYIVYLDIMERKVGKQLDHARIMGTSYVLFIGPDEEKQKKVKLKNMATGKETVIDPEKILL